MELADDEELADQIELDSLAIIQLSIGLEKAFNIQLNGDRLAPEHYRTICAMAKLIEKVKS
jgi:acyl carrier protein